MKTKVFSVMKRKSNYIKIIIVSLIFVTICLILYHSLDFQTNKNGIDIAVNKYFIQTIDLGQIFIGISTALAAILAIVFAISQLIISNVSDKYTPHILEKYKEDKRIYLTFSIFIVTILIAIFSSIFVKDISNSLKLGILLLTTILFGSCFCFLVSYFDYMFDIINPLKFVEKLKEEINDSVKNINENKTKNYVTSLGDIAVKSLRRGEGRTIKQILNTKFEIFENFSALKNNHPKIYRMCKSSGKERNIVFTYILEQQLRIFKNAIHVKNEDITTEIADKLFDHIFKLIQNEKNKDMFSEMMDTEGIRGNFFFQFLEEAIKNNDKSKYRLIKIFPDILRHNQYYKIMFKGYIEDFVFVNIFRNNKLIIENKDNFDLFKQEVADYSLQLSMDPLELVQKIEDILPLLEVPFNYFNSKEETDLFCESRKSLLCFIQFTLMKKFFLEDTYKEFKKMLQEFFDLTEKSCDVIDIDSQYRENPEKFRDLTEEKFEELKKSIQSQISDFKEKREGTITKIESELYNFHIASVLYKTFFDIGWYIIFCKKQKNINAQKYLRELWEHTNPRDSKIITPNHPPICFDIKFLTQILLYGGKEATKFWTPFMYVDDFHDAEKYIYHYYLLILTYSRMRFNGKDLDVSISDRDTQFELEEKYKFVNDFIREKGNLIKYINELIEEADEWNELMHFKKSIAEANEKNERTHLKLKYKEIDAKSALTDTREWIRKKVKEFQRLKNEFESRQPINQEKVKSCREGILKSYKETSEIADIVDQKEFDKSDEELDFIQIYYRPLTPKDWFINNSDVLYDHIWNDFGRIVSLGEINYVLETISENKKIEKEKIELKKKNEIEILFLKIFEIINTLKKKGLNPSVIFIPNEYNSEIHKKTFQEGSILCKKLNYKDGKRYLVPDRNTKLKIFFSSKDIPFRDIIVLDKSAGAWIYKIDEGTGERLFIDIKEYEKDKTKVDIYIRTLVSFKIIDPQKIRILEIESSQ